MTTDANKFIDNCMMFCFGGFVLSLGAFIGEVIMSFVVLDMSQPATPGQVITWAVTVGVIVLFMWIGCISGTRELSANAEHFAYYRREWCVRVSVLRAWLP